MRGFDAWDRGDLETWIELFSPDCEFRTLVTDSVEGTAFKGRDGLRAFWMSQQEIWNNPRHVSERAWRRGRLIIVAGRQRAEGKGSGVEVEMPVFFVSERNSRGKIRWAAQFSSLEDAVATACQRLEAMPDSGSDLDPG
ncbi:MAG: nuclear transport factor 2 family protein [Actinomycetota bacterium]|nr:nuclear transport factor 2 family protein [Actinomycetota bacterium]